MLYHTLEEAIAPLQFDEMKKVLTDFWVTDQWVEFNQVIETLRKQAADIFRDLIDNTPELVPVHVYFGGRVTVPYEYEELVSDFEARINALVASTTFRTTKRLQRCRQR